MLCFIIFGIGLSKQQVVHNSTIIQWAPAYVVEWIVF